MSRWSLPLGRLFGVSVRVHVLLVVLLAALAAGGQGLPALLGFVAVTAHELGHVIAARGLGLGVDRVELWPFGGWSVLVGLESREPATRAVVAMAGPLASLLLAWVTVAARQAWPTDGVLAGYFVDVNLGLALFNLLPAGPLDGGRLWTAFRARRVGYRRAGAEARRAGLWLAAALGAGALVLAAFGVIRPDLFAVAAFLAWAAGRGEPAAYWPLRDLAVREAAFRRQSIWVVEDFAVREDAPVGAVVQEMRPRRLHRVAVLSREQRLLGMIWESDLFRALAERGPETPVRELVAPPN
ncbi:MAG: site-2 protease family protein [Actinomycetia bacterium]|nr:site-2 protease family protein [Actinomycetes bacterium]